jgi:hypothetical protein
MALRMGHVYDALRQAQGVPEEAARQAAEEIAGYENRLANIESDLRVLKWMVGIVIVLVIGLFWQGFAIMGQLPR